MARRDHREVGSSKAPARPSSPETPRKSAADAQLDLDDIAIDRAGEIPIGVQLAWALRARIGDGRLAPGQRLPGLRELAEMLGINANTARAVYQRLEQEGLIDSRQGTGTFVTSVGQEPSAVGQIAADAARQARRTGVDPREVAAALYVTSKAPTYTAVHPEDHAQATYGKQASERRRELRAQIAALEQTLSEIQARHPGLIPAPSKPHRQAGPRLLNARELERVRTELVRRLAAAEPLLKAPAAKQATASDHMETASAVAPAQQAGDELAKPAAVRKVTGPRPRTRPSTA